MVAELKDEIMMLKEQILEKTRWIKDSRIAPKTGFDYGWRHETTQ